MKPDDVFDEQALQGAFDAGQELLNHVELFVMEPTASSASAPSAYDGATVDELISSETLLVASRISSGCSCAVRRRRPRAVVAAAAAAAAAVAQTCWLATPAQPGTRRGPCRRARALDRGAAWSAFPAAQRQHARHCDSAASARGAQPSRSLVTYVDERARGPGQLLDLIARWVLQRARQRRLRRPSRPGTCALRATLFCVSSPSTCTARGARQQLEHAMAEDAAKRLLLEFESGGGRRVARQTPRLPH